MQWQHDQATWPIQRTRRLARVLPGVDRLGIVVAAVLVSVGSAVSSPQAASAPIPVGGCSADPPAPAADRPRYRVSATFDPTSGRVSGTSTVQFLPDAAIDRVVFRLWPNGGLRDATAPSATIASASVAVGQNSVQSARPQVISPTVVSLPVSAQPGELVTVALTFSVLARGERNDRISLTRSRSGFVAARFGSFLPVLAWEPGLGWNLTPPTRSGAEASMTVAADWDVSLTLGGPGSSDLVVLASGEEVQPGRWVSVGERDWAMSVGRFTQDDGSLVRSTVSLGPGRRSIRVTVGVARPIAESASEYRARVVRAIRVLSDLYGDYPWPTYTLAITPGLKGGIEFPSHVMQGPGSTGRTTTHEVAHQWFYALVGNDQGRDPWIDEGLATWAEARADSTLDAFGVKPIPADGTARAGNAMTYWDKHRSSYYRAVYVQTLQALRALGDPAAVDCALITLINRTGHRVARARDVIDAMSTQFPEASSVLRRYGIVADAP
jgi:hypothetical protein